VTRGFFPGSDFDYEHLEKKEPSRLMTVPLMLLAAAAVVLGIFPAGLTDFVSSVAAALM